MLQWVTCWGSGGKSVRGRVTPGGRGGPWLSLSHVPSLPSCTWYKGGETQTLMKHLIHSVCCMKHWQQHSSHFLVWWWCQLQLFAGRTSVDRCITDANGAALQLETINVSTWILINLQNSIYYTCCYRVGMKAVSEIDASSIYTIYNPVMASSQADV